ncbi:BZ3500_MvSof-1268-A1-R1_Chr1-3g01894 [Microbotryum saponariae]|uniref:BZ3500_MvSof-1268-A1-R1_Chr1-3g01894 protein n=1 Tax=Microbotryum saponariae TaxID=289078 RepID=A0A2X0KHD6_9BASI|nr:BZ3500_MvSof-1268-A1-R1_Chr1-3g01894 [Microbotryum saponariae]SCZ94847.1 BZ3501_MvSof-1269-A2-R1_Chr1-3g01496 [Microbotryum saponariae]
MNGNIIDTGGGTSQYQSLGTTFAPTRYTTVQGFFKQADPKFNSKGYDLLDDSFGLIEQGPDRWHTFHAQIDKLNREADKQTTYKVVYLARHGQGYHNVAESKYGTAAWDAYWSRLETDGNITWGPDPPLTPLGRRQAEDINTAWKRQVAEGVPLPERLYSSPFTRAADTLQITWHDILLNKGLKPLILERLRETIGCHTCDKRSEKTIIRERFPTYDIEPGFSEHDQLWSTDYQESPRQQALRIQQQLNQVSPSEETYKPSNLTRERARSLVGSQIFDTDPSTFISITAHSGVINAFFRVVEHPDVSILPGGFVPIVVRATSDPNERGQSFAGGQAVYAGPFDGKLPPP